MVLWKVVNGALEKIWYWSDMHEPCYFHLSIPISRAGQGFLRRSRHHYNASFCWVVMDCIIPLRRGGLALRPRNQNVSDLYVHLYWRIQCVTCPAHSHCCFDCILECSKERRFIFWKVKIRSHQTVGFVITDNSLPSSNSSLPRCLLDRGHTHASIPSPLCMTIPVALRRSLWRERGRCVDFYWISPLNMCMFHRLNEWMNEWILKRDV